jgi:hypothetical protein
VSGGEEAWQAIGEFMSNLRQRRGETGAYHRG